MAIKNGLYQHYKGSKYLVWEICKSSEDGELQVLYKQMPNDIGDEQEILEKMFWVRPLKMWDEEVEIAGCKVPRFKLICIIK